MTEKKKTRAGGLPGKPMNDQHVTAKPREMPIKHCDDPECWRDLGHTGPCATKGFLDRLARGEVTLYEMRMWEA